VHESFAKVLLRVWHRYVPWPRRMYEDVMATDRPAQRPACLLEFADKVGVFQGGYSNHRPRVLVNTIPTAYARRLRSAQPHAVERCLDR
jgi:hypothetical protein